MSFLPNGPAGTDWMLVWHDEFDDTPGMSGPNNGLSSAKWNGGWYTGPSALGVGVNATTDPIDLVNEFAYHGPAGILFPGDGAVHLRLLAGVDNGGSYHARTVESGMLTTAGLMVLNPANVSISQANPDLFPYTVNGHCVLEVKMRVPGPNASAGAYWPALFLSNAGNYGGSNPGSDGTNWPGGQAYLEEIDLVEMAGGGSLGSSSAFHFHAASSYAASGIPGPLASTDLSLAYHVYTYEFLSNTLNLWVDGIAVPGVAPSASQIAAQWQFPQYLLIAFGAKAGASYPTTAAGTPSDMMIDYVRVWLDTAAVQTVFMAVPGYIPGLPGVFGGGQDVVVDVGRKRVVQKIPVL